MTREEAIEYLIGMDIETLPDGLDEAIRMAIEALSADAVQGFRGGKIPPKEMLNGTVLIPQHQWLEMERELAELKSKFESAEAVQGWIPCSERLPSKRQSVLISTSECFVGEGCYWETTEHHVIWKGYRWNATYWDDEVVAWMPLPEPYKGGDSE